MATAKTPIYQQEEWFNPNVVKVVTDSQGHALYFSRAPIPYLRDKAVSERGIQTSSHSENGRIWGYRHVGIYVYRRDFLMKFAGLRSTSLERTEGLAQLRALAYGYRIRVADVDEPSVEVDTPEDLARAESYLKEQL